MNYEFSYNSDLYIIESVTHGLASKTEIVDMLHSITELCVKNESADIIVDHSQLDTGTPTMDDISHISRQVASVKDILKTRKCAHVVTKDI